MPTKIKHTTAPVQAEKASSVKKPEFIRLPKDGAGCPFTGLSRTTMIRLVTARPENGNKPPVKSFCVRQSGKARGVRLIDYASLITFLRSQTYIAGQ
jgi:hypothetical protein